MSDNLDLGPIKTERKTGAERFSQKGQELVFNLADFWGWAYSDLIGNTERGRLAEYIVAMALGITDGISQSWGRYDLLSKEGIAVEVKTSGYIQTWAQKRPSNITFGIPATYGWDPVTNDWDSDKRRQADVYVFCVHHHLEQATINPLNIDQWTFYVINTARLDNMSITMKTISLKRLIQEGAVKCDFERLHEEVVRAAASAGNFD